MNGDHSLLVSGDHPCRDGAVRGGNARAARSVRGGVEANSKPFGVAADALPDLRCVLADAGGEDKRIDAAEHRSQRAQVFRDVVDEQLDRLLRPRIVARQEVAHVIADLGHPEQPDSV